VSTVDIRPAVLTGLWALCVGAGLVAMVKYETTPGAAAVPPAKIAVPGKTAKDRLLLFLHPQCACSLATVGELERVLDRAHASLETTVYFYKPSSEPESFCVGTPLWNKAKNLTGTSLQVDPDGKAAKTYGARCSGQVLLYAAKTGKLVFSGGVTESRGHEGESRGSDAILQYLRTGQCTVPKTSVFGCAIW
jgi:hypothetical protein